MDARGARAMLRVAPNVGTQNILAKGSNQEKNGREMQGCATSSECDWLDCFSGSSWKFASGFDLAAMVSQCIAVKLRC